MEEKTLKDESTLAKKAENSNDYGNMEKNELTYERKAVEGTPFVIHYSQSHGWAMGIAEHKLTGWYETEKEVKNLLKGKKKNGDLDWDMITGVVLILVEKVLERKKIQELIMEKQEEQ